MDKARTLSKFTNCFRDGAHFQTKESYNITKCTILLNRHTQARIANYNYTQSQLCQ